MKSLKEMFEEIDEACEKFGIDTSKPKKQTDYEKGYYDGLQEAVELIKNLAEGVPTDI